MSRIKRVFSNSSQVVHLWANQSQDATRCANVFFEGRSIYSYGYHYELGRLVEINGQQVALINSTGYSVTTSKHISQARLATTHLYQLEVDHSFDIDKALINWQDRLITEFFENFSRRSFYELLIPSRSYYFEQLTEFNHLCDLLKKPQLKFEIPEELLSLANEHIANRLRIQNEKDAEKRLLRELAEKRLQTEALEKLEAWKSGEDVRVSFHFVRPMQIRVKGDKVQTTGGAEVPLTEALKLLNLIDSGVAIRGQRVGPFTFDSINSGVVKIGCHDIDLNHAREVLSKATKPRLELVTNKFQGA